MKPTRSARLVPAGATLKGLDFDASYEAVLRTDLGRYRIVHFATHSVLNSRHPELSGVVLSVFDRDGHWQNGSLFHAPGRVGVNRVGEAIRQKWSLTQEAFDRLLASLDMDRDIAADRYLEIRRNLVRLFEWRGCATPDEYADETLNRCARKINDGEEIRDLATYSIGVARMLLREMGRDRAKEGRSLDDAPEPRVMPPELGGDAERRVECLRRCLAQLPPENRDLILTYYEGDKGDKIRIARALPSCSAFRQAPCACEPCGFANGFSYAPRIVCKDSRAILVTNSNVVPVLYMLYRL